MGENSDLKFFASLGERGKEMGDEEVLKTHPEGDASTKKVSDDWWLDEDGTDPFADGSHAFQPRKAAPRREGLDDVYVPFRDRRVRAERAVADKEMRAAAVDTTRIEAYRERSGEESAECDDRYQQYVDRLSALYETVRIVDAPDVTERIGVIEDVIGTSLDSVDLRQHAFAMELVTDAEVFDTWSKVFVEQDRVFLEQRSQQVLSTLRSVHKQEMHAFARGGDIHEFAHRSRRAKAFRKMDLNPVHGSSHEINDMVVRANRHLEDGAELRTAAGDLFIGGDRFVYGSFAEAPHDFTGQVYADDLRPDIPLAGTPEGVDAMELPVLNPDTDQYRLDESTFGETTDFAMLDIHLTKVGPKSGRGGFLETYLDNYFTYETGKDILKEYLNLIFETPEEAIAYFSGMSELRTEQFYKEYPPGGVWVRGFSQARAQEIHDRIRTLYLEHGIVPPYLSEIRIPEQAGILDSSDTAGVTII